MSGLESTSWNDTQFADYHGHGWNFRAIYKRSSARGTLLDAKGEHRLRATTPKKFQKAVHHVADIHA